MAQGHGTPLTVEIILVILLTQAHGQTIGEFPIPPSKSNGPFITAGYLVQRSRSAPYDRATALPVSSQQVQTTSPGQPDLETTSLQSLLPQTHLQPHQDSELNTEPKRQWKALRPRRLVKRKRKQRKSQDQTFSCDCSANSTQFTFENTSKPICPTVCSKENDQNSDVLNDGGAGSVDDVSRTTTHNAPLSEDDNCDNEPYCKQEALTDPAKKVVKNKDGDVNLSIIISEALESPNKPTIKKTENNETRQKHVDSTSKSISQHEKAFSPINNVQMENTELMPGINTNVHPEETQKNNSLRDDQRIILGTEKHLGNNDKADITIDKDTAVPDFDFLDVVLFAPTETNTRKLQLITSKRSLSSPQDKNITSTSQLTTNPSDVVSKTENELEDSATTAPAGLLPGKESEAEVSEDLTETAPDTNSDPTQVMSEDSLMTTSSSLSDTTLNASVNSSQFSDVSTEISFETSSDSQDNSTILSLETDISFKEASTNSTLETDNSFKEASANSTLETTNSQTTKNSSISADELLSLLSLTEEQQELLLSELAVSTTNMTSEEKNVVVRLLQLEKLREEQQGLQLQLEEQLQQLEQLLTTDGETVQLRSNRTDVNSLLAGNSLTRGGKSSFGGGADEGDEGGLGNITNIISTKLNLFENIQDQLVSQLKSRSEFLQLLTSKISAEKSAITQALSLFGDLLRMSSDPPSSSSLLNLDTSPILGLLEGLEEGPSTLLLIVSKFFQVLESILSLKTEFLLAFSQGGMEGDVGGVLQKIQTEGIGRILPAKLKLVTNILEDSEELGRLVSEIFNCLGELIIAKTELVQLLGRVISRKIEFLQGFSGNIDITEGSSNSGENDIKKKKKSVITALKEGRLYTLLNLSQKTFRGSDFLSRDLEAMLGRSIASFNPKDPILGMPLKPLLVDHRELGMLTGAARSRKINGILAGKLENFISRSTAQLVVRQGEAVLKTFLPDINLGDRCTNEIRLQGSVMEARVRRTSPLSVTAGVTIYNRGRPTFDIVKLGIIYTDISMKGGITVSKGNSLFNKCINKITKNLPLQMKGLGIADVSAKIIVTDVTVQNRPTSINILPGVPSPFTNLRPGLIRPHIVLRYTIKINGRLLDVDVKKLKLTGCQVKLLGLPIFSYCSLLENLLRSEIEKAVNTSFPLSSPQLLSGIENMIKMRLGEELAIPLVITDDEDLSSVRRVVEKSRKLLDLNIQLFTRLSKFAPDVNNILNPGSGKANSSFDSQSISSPGSYGNVLTDTDHDSYSIPLDPPVTEYNSSPVSYSDSSSSYAPEPAYSETNTPPVYPSAPVSYTGGYISSPGPSPVYSPPAVSYTEVLRSPKQIIPSHSHNPSHSRSSQAPLSYSGAYSSVSSSQAYSYPAESASGAHAWGSVKN